jgi:hypothetical protein
MIFWPRVQFCIWYFDPGVILLSLYWSPQPMVFWPPAHGISTPLRMIYQTLWGCLMVLWTLSFGRNEGGSIYTERIQNTMTTKLPRGQNTICKIEPWVKISYVNWPRGQFTMGFKIPYDTGITIKPFYERVIENNTELITMNCIWRKKKR